MRALVLEADINQRKAIAAAVHQAGHGALFAASQQEVLDLLREEKSELVVISHPPGNILAIQQLLPLSKSALRPLLHPRQIFPEVIYSL